MSTRPLAAVGARIGAIARENANGVVVLLGAVWLYAGIAGFSRHAADVVAGALLILIGVVPYVARLRKRKP